MKESKQGNAKRYIDTDHHLLRNRSELVRNNPNIRNKFYDPGYENEDYDPSLDGLVKEKNTAFMVQLPADEFMKLHVHIAGTGLKKRQWLRKIIQRLPNRRA